MMLPMSALKMPTHPVARIEPLRVASQKTTPSQPPESVAASPPPDENDFPSSNTHAPAIRLLAILPKRLQKPPRSSPWKKPRRNFKISH
jgi:hypothetical protein